MSLADAAGHGDDPQLEKDCARLKIVRTELSKLKKEEQKLRDKIIAHPLCREGYNNADVEIAGAEVLDVEDPRIAAALKEENVMDQAVNVSLSIPKIRKLGEKYESIAQAIELATSRARKVKITK